MKIEEGEERKRSEIETVNLDLVAVVAEAGAEKGEGGVVVGKEAEGTGIGLLTTSKINCSVFIFHLTINPGVLLSLVIIETGNMIGEILGRIYLLTTLSWLATCHFM